MHREERQQASRLHAALNGFAEALESAATAGRAMIGALIDTIAAARGEQQIQREQIDELERRIQALEQREQS